MKKARKILLYIFFTFISLLVVLLILAALFENKIAKIAVDQVSRTMNIPIEIDDIHFSLVHNFPFATIRCENLKVSSPDSNAKVNTDTLVFLSELYVSVDTKPLLKGIFNIRKVEISDGKLFYNVDTAGVSNFDFLIDTTQQNVVDTSANTIFLDIKDFTVENTTCYFEDKDQKATAAFFIENLDLSGLINDDEYKGEAEGKAILTNCSYDTTNVYLMNQAILDFKMAYADGSLTVGKTDVSIDEDALLSLDGLINFKDSMSAVLNVNAEKLDLAGLSKYVPENYFREYGIKTLSGLLAAEAYISGNLVDSVKPFVEATFRLSDANLQYEDYPALNHISMNGKATNGNQKNNATTSIDIDSMYFQTQNSKFNLSGNFQNPEKLSYNLNSTIDLDLDEIEDFVPDSLLQSLSGRVMGTISTNGTLADSITDEFIQSALANTRAKLILGNVDASVDSLLSIKGINAELQYQSNRVLVTRFKAGVQYDKYNLDSLKLEAVITGDLTQPDSLDIQLNKLSAALGNNSVGLTGNLKYPFAPDYSVSGNVHLNLAEIQKFVPDSLVNKMSGDVSASFTSAAKLNLDSISSQIIPLIFEKGNFNTVLSQVNLAMPDSIMSVSNLSGSLNYDSNTLQIEQLEASYLGIQLGMNSVTAANVYSAAIQNQPKELVVHGNFSAGDLDYALLEKLMQEDSTAVPETEAEPMNFTYKINGRFKSNSLKYGNALFTDVNSKFLIKEGHYVFDSLHMNAFDGSAISSIKLDMLPNDELDVYFKTDINKMDVAKIIKGFNQYIDYEDISSENVQGNVSTKMDGKIVLKDFEPVYNSLLLNGELTIENGALINVKPVMEVEKIPGIGIKNMDKLYFSTLTSNLFLFNNELYIPRTEIRSTSFDAMFLGMYSFGEDYEYHIRMFLGEVLSSKSKNNLKKQAQEGGFTDEDEKDVTKGRTSIYVVSKSIDGDEKAGFDNKRDRANMAAKVNLQKQMVDMRFHPTLVNYDTEVK